MATKPVKRPYKKRGVPDTYKPEYAEWAYKLTLLGLTEEKIAANLDVAYATFNNWKKRHPDLVEALKKAGDIADAEVVFSLRQRAIGYSHPEEKIFLHQDSGRVVKARTTKHYPPDPVAAMMVLSNRQRTLWKHAHSLDVTNSDGSFAMFANAMRRAHQAIDAEVRVLEEPATPMRIEHEP